MNGKRDKGPAENPWVRKTEPAEDETAATEPELPPSPWSLEVPPRPSPWTDTGAAGTASAPGAGNGAGTAGTPGGWGGQPTADPQGSWTSQPPDPDAADTPDAAETGWGRANGVPGGPATQTTSAWGDKVGPPSLRRPPPAKKKPAVPPLLIPVVAGVAVVALVAVALVLLTRGDENAGPGPTPSMTVTTPPASTYTPPPNAIPVAHGVSVVPVDGWSLLAKETRGKQLVTYAPNGEPRAFLWVRQKLNTSARAYVIGIVEGETENEIAQLGNVRNLPCPRDVLVECVAITYTSVAKGVNVKGWVEAYRRKDGVVTALDFRTRADYAAKAEADAAPMKQSVIDSL